MKKEDYIEKYGEDAYGKQQEQTRNWQSVHPARVLENARIWAINNPEKVLARNHEMCRKDGKRYERYRKIETTGLRGARNCIRKGHAQRWRKFKKIIAPDSQLHHQWIPGTADYAGVALVEQDQHLHGFIDVIEILEGEITLLTEAEIRGDKGQ